MATAHPVTDPDYADHLETYRGFLRGVRWSLATIATVLVLLAYFLG